MMWVALQLDVTVFAGLAPTGRAAAGGVAVLLVLGRSVDLGVASA
jgi:hypothetical protein